MNQPIKLLGALLAVASLAAAPRPARANEFFDCLQSAGPDELKAAGDATMAVAALVDDPVCNALTGNPLYVGLAAAIAGTSLAANASGNAALLSVFANSQTCQHAPENAALAIANVLLPLIPGLKNNAALLNAIKAGDSTAASQALQPALDPFLSPYNCACKFADLAKDAKQLVEDGLKNVKDAQACGRLLGDVVQSIGEDVEHLNPSCCLLSGTTAVGGTQQFYSCPADDCNPVESNQPAVECACNPPRVLSASGICGCPSGIFTGFQTVEGKGYCDPSSGAPAGFRPQRYNGGSCSKCPPNSLPDTFHNKCVSLPCPVGKSAGATPGSCQSVCPAAKHFDKGTKKCTYCSWDSIPDAQGTGCWVCPSGQFSDGLRGVDYENVKPKCVAINKCAPGLVHYLADPTRCVPCDDQDSAPDGLFDCKKTDAGIAKANWLAQCLKAGRIADENSTTHGCKKCPGQSKAWAGSGFPGECSTSGTLPPPVIGPKKKVPIKQ